MIFSPIFHYIKCTKMQRLNGTTLEQHKFGPIFQMRVHNVVAASSTESYYLFAAHPPDIDCIDLDTPVNRPLDISLLWVTQPVDYRCNYECRVCFINDRVLKFCSGKSVVNLVSGFDEVSHWERHSTHAFPIFCRHSVVPMHVCTAYKQRICIKNVLSIGALVHHSYLRVWRVHSSVGWVSIVIIKLSIYPWIPGS